MATIASLERDILNIRAQLHTLEVEVNVVKGLLEQAVSTHQLSRSMELLEKTVTEITDRVTALEDTTTDLTEQIDE